MNLATFWENFEVIAEAPGGVQRLRELILDLAVRGKLVPQDLGDDSVIAQKLGDWSENAESLPKGWSLIPLEDVTTVVSGHNFKSGDFNKFSGVKAIKITNVGVGEFVETPEFLPHNFLETHHRFIVNSGDIIIALTRPYISNGLKVCVCPENYNVSLLNQRVAAVKVHADILFASFLYLYLRCNRVLMFVREASRTLNQPNLSIRSLKKILVPLPPFTEQKRIVAKVDELMALCDRYEVLKCDRNTLRTKMRASAIDALMNAETDESLNTAWKLVQDNWECLSQQLDDVKKLREVFLQLAVRGKLGTSNDADEPANIFLKEIKTRKSALVSAGKIRKTRLSRQLTEDDILYPIPKTWQWVILDELSDIGTGSTPLKSNSDYYADGSIPWVTSAATAKDFIEEANTLITHLAVQGHRLRIYEPGCLVIALYGQGKTRGQVSELKICATVNQACAAITLIEESEAHKQYIRYVFEKKYEELRALAAGGAQPNLNVKKIKETVIPLPPLAEQKRIVAKVNQLMALCDTLETHLYETQEKATALAAAVIGQLEV